MDLCEVIAFVVLLPVILIVGLSFLLAYVVATVAVALYEWWRTR